MFHFIAICEIQRSSEVWNSSSDIKSVRTRRYQFSRLSCQALAHCFTMVNGFPEKEKTKYWSRVGQLLEALCGINVYIYDNNLVFFIRGKILPHNTTPVRKLASAHISDILSAVLKSVLVLLSLSVCTGLTAFNYTHISALHLSWFIVSRHWLLFLGVARVYTHARRYGNKVFVISKYLSISISASFQNPLSHEMLKTRLN